MGCGGGKAAGKAKKSNPYGTHSIATNVHSSKKAKNSCSIQTKSLRNLKKHLSKLKPKLKQKKKKKSKSNPYGTHTVH